MTRAAPSFARVAELFDALVVLPPDARATVLEQRCSDPRVRAEVLALLAADARASGFLEQPHAALTGTLPRPGQRLGNYLLLRELGRGGMGSVYLAARADGAYRQQVALKLFAFDSARVDLLRRFEAERQILAELSHPGIARLLDGGTGHDGRPYLVMEYVDGLPLDRYCDEHALSVSACVDLVCEVGAAVAHAHRHLVVHRDLKPANILVGADGHPRLLDFGIAKVLLEPASRAPAPPVTHTDLRAMTLAFASPEQVLGQRLGTATDVYSLAVVLYHLLTGRSPYRPTGPHVAALEQAILEQEPEPPSQALLRCTPTRRGRARSLSGDLDRVVLKALRKDSLERYLSVDGFVADLRRWRAGHPVQARPPSRAYRLGRFAARHRWALTSATLVLVVVAGLVAGLVVQRARLATQRDAIRAERDKALEVVRLLESIFEDADPGRTRGESLTVREVLAAGAARTSELRAQPHVQAALLMTLGKAQRGLGRFAEAQALLERARELRAHEPSISAADLAETLEELAEVDLYRGAAVRAEQLLGEAIGLRRLVGEPLALGSSLGAWGTSLMVLGRLERAEQVLDEAWATLASTPGGTESSRAGAVLAAQASLRQQQGDLVNAEASSARALALLRRWHPEAHPLVVNQLNNLALVVQARGDTARAEALLRESLTGARRLYGNGHPEVAMRLSNLAFLLNARSRPVEALPVAREAVAQLRRAFGPSSERLAIGLNNLARAHEDLAQWVAAERYLSEAAATAVRAGASGHAVRARVLVNRALVRVHRRALGAALADAREALEQSRAMLGEQHVDTAQAQIALGRVLLAQGRRSGALSWLQAGLQGLRARLPAEHWQVGVAESVLGHALGREPARRAEALALLRQGYERVLRARGPSAVATRDAARRLNELVVASDRSGAQPGRTRARR